MNDSIRSRLGSMNADGEITTAIPTDDESESSMDDDTHASARKHWTEADEDELCSMDDGGKDLHGIAEVCGSKNVGDFS